MKKQQRNRIGWCNITINPIKGICPNVECEIRKICYGIRRYKRFRWDPTLRLDLSVFDQLENMAPSRVFVCSTCEPFHPDLPSTWISEIIDRANELPQHNFLFLTKCPGHALWWYENHVWLGVSVTNHSTLERINTLRRLKLDNKAVSHIFVSFEPVISRIFFDRYNPSVTLMGIDWCLVGAKTPQGKSSYPNLEWIQDILYVADSFKVPVWMKENLLIQRRPKTIIANKGGE